MQLNDWDLSEESWEQLWGQMWNLSSTTPRDTSGNHPEKIVNSVYPVEARAVILHLLIAAALPVIFFAGKLIEASGFLPEYIVGSVILGFLVGIARYVSAIAQRQRVQVNTPGLRAGDLEPIPSLYSLAIRPLFVWPLAVGIVAVYSIWSENHFVAIALPAFICFYAFFYLGSKPIDFLQEYLMAQPEVEPVDRKYRPRGISTPDFYVLLGVLFILLTAPILLSTAHTYLILSAILCGILVAKVKRLRHRHSVALSTYLLKRCHSLARVYLDQPDVEKEKINEQWTPPSSRVNRFITFLALMVPLHVVLITGTTYYCPWEFFAALFVPDFETNFLFIPASRPLGYDWLYKPFLLAFEAKPIAGYLLTFIAGILGFLVFPPLFLLALYFDRIVALERLHQEIKAVRRSSQEPQAEKP